MFHFFDSGLNDITGTHFSANKKIAVFSGNRYGSLNSGIQDHISEQMQPARTYGKTFGVVPFDSNTNNYILIAVAKEASTTVTFNGLPTTLNLAGDFTQQFRVNRNQYVYVTSNKPIQLSQWLSGGSRLAEDGPSMVLIPPTEQFSTFYTFIVPTHVESGTYRSQLQVVIENGQEDSLQLNGASFPSANWQSIGSSNLRGASISLGSGVYTISSRVKFGIYLKTSSDGECAFAYGGGQCFNDLDVSTRLIFN